jgi:hypothetical protein
MNNIDECIIHYRRLHNLLIDDETEIACCFEGEILDAYRAVLKEEIQMMESMMKSLLQLEH